MRLDSWFRSVDWLNSQDSWLSGNQASAHLARDALNELSERGWIGHWFAAEPQANGRPGKPEAAYRASELREALLRLAVVRGLMHQAAHGMSRLDDIVQAIVPIVMESSTGLRASSTADATGPYRHADFARSASAQEFFQGVVSPKLVALDNEFGTCLRSLAQRRFAANSPESLEHWGRLWTLCTALTPLSWVRARGCLDAWDIARALWCSRGPTGQALPRFYVRAGPLPTGSQLPGVDGRVSVHAELRMRPTLAQVLEGRAEWWDLPADAACAIHVPLKAIDYVTTMMRNEQKVHYRGRNVLQLYLAVLADALLGGDVDRDTPMQSLAWAAQAAAHRSHGTLVSPHERALSRLNSGERPQGLAIPRRPVRKASADTPELWDSFFSAQSVGLDTSRLHLSPADGSTRQRWQVFGTLDAWSPVEAAMDGSDWLFVARSGQERVALPVFLQIKDSDVVDGTENTASLILDTGDSTAWPSAQWLRQVCARKDGVRVECETVGRWAFVVIEFHD